MSRKPEEAGSYITKAYLIAECAENIKLKWQKDYQWDNFSDSFLKTNMEEEQLASVTGKEFQIVGPQ